MEVKNVSVTAKDIRNIGNTQFKGSDGSLSIICDGNTSNIEGILLRNILKCFGDEYEIVDSEDYVWENNEGKEIYDILFKTNLPADFLEL